jgi:hypothetical protein
MSARALYAESHSDSNFRVGTGVDHNEARIGVNGNNSGFPYTPLLDLALGLLTLTKSNFDFAKLYLYLFTGFRI